MGWADYEKNRSAMKPILLFILLLKWVSGGYGSTEFERRSLKGLEGIHPVVEALDPEEEHDGLTAGQLLSEVVYQLQQAGIRVLTQEECENMPGMPYLYVNINAIQLTTQPSYIYAIGVELKQTVSLVRNPDVVSVGSTWRAGTLGIVPITDMPHRIRAAVGEKVDAFIYDYLAVNPIEDTE